MITLLRKLFLKNESDMPVADRRTALGTLCSVTGICLNVLLFAGKFIAGTLSSSVAITADAFNNLSDAGASVITLIGFRLAEQAPDRDHPFGHGRMEYISGFVVAVAIILMGVELIQTSFQKILHPQAIVVTPLVLFFLIVSIGVKLYMVFYNSRVGKEIGSESMHATAVDSRNDCIGTAAVLGATIVGGLTGLRIDGYVGFLVGLFVLWSGISTAKDTINPLLGQPPGEAFVNDVERLVTSYPYVEGIHDMVVHDYGPGRIMVSLHAEVPADGDIMVLHDTIDRIEKEVGKELNCEMVIHMDPIVTNNAEVNASKVMTQKIVEEIDPQFTIHDFRIVTGPTHTNLIFDVVLPAGCKMSDEEVRDAITEKIRAVNSHYEAVIQVDHAYVL